ncbi:organic solvent tolerance protein OstA, putative [Rhodospirillum centenum SW]|uniref:LPS-assembly protein LptD n=1 Tax=Rhodospirillum centenum (strain ATCC 51521 / SW) TaxID=414684 RepID=B6IT24_RHOCS|nr:organic solvent tolerance protein OstA, putative [Rhodospirillum centenum SW]
MPSPADPEPDGVTSPRRILGAAALLGLLADPAMAQTAQDGQPVLLSADSLDYNEDLGIVTARGHVELAQGSRILLADTVSYSEKTNVVTATGNVSLLEPSGEVVFADYVELTDDMRQGFVDKVRLLMTDNSRLAGAQGERVDGRYTRIERGVYSPCELCKEDPTQPPIWQIRAARVTHDQESRDVYYRDAVLEIAGIPVAYTPFFAHPDPTVERRSGFLAPGGGFGSDLGTFARLYYFFDITPSQDFTLEMTPSTEDGLLLGGEYRQRFTNGSLRLSGSATYADLTEGFGEEQRSEKKFRGHLFGSGRFNIDNEWRWGFDVQRVTDSSHLRRYDYSDEDLLTSRGFLEWFRARDYFSVNAYSFQDLRPGNEEEEPLVMPLATYGALGEPGAFLGGTWSLDGNLLALWRNDGTDTRRASSEVGWRRDFVAPIGLVTSVTGSLRGDAYWIGDLRTTGANSADAGSDSTELRLFPQGQVTMSLPLVRQAGTVQQLIEPILAFTAAPKLDSDDVPNEDSQDIEFDHTNLFLTSRFPGVDRLEGGQRVTYGLRAGFYGFGGGSSTLFLGQSYRLQRDNDFPAGSGLEGRQSDIVGRIEVTPSPWLDFSYGFRLDSETLDQRRHDVFGVVGPPEFRVSGSYIYLDRLTLEDGTATRNREELTLGVNSAFSENWSVGVSHRRDLATGGGAVSSGMMLTYQDECMTFQLIGERDFTRRSGLDTGDKVYFRLVFKNLGEFLSPALSGDVFGQGQGS